MIAARSIVLLQRRWHALPQRYRQLLFALAVLLVCLGVDGIMIRPLRRQLARLHERIREAEQRLTEATIASGQAEAVAQAFTAYAPYAQPSGSREAELAGLLTEVESAVRETGMVLLNLKPEDIGADAGKALAIRVEAEAGTAQLLQLLDRLQRSPRLLNVSELSVRVAEGRTLRTTLVITRRRLLPGTG